MYKRQYFDNPASEKINSDDFRTLTQRLRTRFPEFKIIIGIDSAESASANKNDFEYCTNILLLNTNEFDSVKTTKEIEYINSEFDNISEIWLEVRSSGDSDKNLMSDIRNANALAQRHENVTGIIPSDVKGVYDNTELRQYHVEAVSYTHLDNIIMDMDMDINGFIMYIHC